MEIDGPEGSAPGSFMLKNITLIGSMSAEDGEYNDNRKGATGTINGLLAYGFQVGKDFELDAEADEDTFLAGDLVFQNLEVVVPDGDTLTGGQIFDAKANHDASLITTYEELKISLVKLLQKLLQMLHLLQLELICLNSVGLWQKTQENFNYLS